MKRILFVTDSLMAGGTEQQLVELVHALDRRRFEPFVMCLYGSKTGRNLHFLKLLQELEVPVTVLDQSSRLKLVASIIRGVWRIRPDVIQAVNYHSNLLVRLARPLLPSSTKLIGCVYVEYTRKQIFYEQLSAWLCDAVVCNSSYLKEQLGRALGGRRIDLIYNGVDRMRFEFSSGVSLRDRHAPGARCILLFMGRIARQKAVHHVVDALGLLKQRDQLPSGTHFWIVGECAERQAQIQLEQAISRCGLEGVVRQFAATYLPEVFYQAADVVVVASLWEGLPNVILEAMASGRPVIASEAANRAEVIQDGSNGWVVRTGDVADLMIVLGKVVNMSGIPEEMRQVCRRTALPFTTIVMVEAFSDLYDRVSARV